MRHQIHLSAYFILSPFETKQSFGIGVLSPNWDYKNTSYIKKILKNIYDYIHITFI